MGQSNSVKSEPSTTAKVAILVARNVEAATTVATVTKVGTTTNTFDW